MEIPMIKRHHLVWRGSWVAKMLPASCTEGKMILLVQERFGRQIGGAKFAAHGTRNRRWTQNCFPLFCTKTKQSHHTFPCAAPSDGDGFSASKVFGLEGPLRLAKLFLALAAKMTKRRGSQKGDGQACSDRSI